MPRYEDYEQFEEVCVCNGSGQGSADGTRCLSCRGAGVVNREYEDAVEAEWEDEQDRRYHARKEGEAIEELARKESR